MLKWGMVGDMKCLLCRNIIECREHLFFDCGWSKRFWREVMVRCFISSICFDWDEVGREGVKAWKGKKLHNIACKLALGATVYNIWKHQNNIKFCNWVNSEE
jgi:hypothetical protein